MPPRLWWGMWGAVQQLGHPWDPVQIQRAHKTRSSAPVFPMPDPYDSQILFGGAVHDSLLQCLQLRLVQLRFGLKLWCKPAPVSPRCTAKANGARTSTAFCMEAMASSFFSSRNWQTPICHPPRVRSQAHPHRRSYSLAQRSSRLSYPAPARPSLPHKICRQGS